jgi:hypothetical protein
MMSFNNGQKSGKSEIEEKVRVVEVSKNTCTFLIEVTKYKYVIQRKVNQV